MRQRAWRDGAFVILALAVVGTAAGQAQVTRTVSATPGGEERSWSTLGLTTSEGTQGTATWSSIVGTLLTLTSSSPTVAARTAWPEAPRVRSPTARA